MYHNKHGHPMTADKNGSHRPRSGAQHSPVHEQTVLYSQGTSKSIIMASSRPNCGTLPFSPALRHVESNEDRGEEDGVAERGSSTKRIKSRDRTVSPNPGVETMHLVVQYRSMSRRQLRYDGVFISGSPRVVERVETKITDGI